MEVHFKVLVSSNIRRKKPWSCISWIGQEKESVCLLDRKRASILYLPSGHTKRDIDVLKPYKKKILFLTTSLSGEYVIGLLDSGHVLRWHKDTNMILIIPLAAGFNLFSGKGSRKVRLFISNDGHKIVGIFHNQLIHVWEENMIGMEYGEWSNVSIDQSLLNLLASQEAAVDAVFYTNQLQGNCCMCTFVCSDTVGVNITCLLLRWKDDHMSLSMDEPNFSSSLMSTTFPMKSIHLLGQQLQIRNCYVPCLSHSGGTVAIAINQLQQELSSVLFVDVHHMVAWTTNHGKIHFNKVKSTPHLAKTYWIGQMAWSNDDLLLFCMTRRGSLLIFNSIGEPLSFAVHGLGVDMGPTKLAPLHPLVEPASVLATSKPLSTQTSETSSIASEKSLKQKFSVTTHPRLPIVLCSDGFMVTAMQLTSSVKIRDLATLSLIEANERVKMVVDQFHLKVSVGKSPAYDEPLPVEEGVKFREYRYVRLYEYLRRKLTKKKSNEELKETKHDDSFKDDSINVLAYEFEKAEREMFSDPDDDSVDDKGELGLVVGADEGHINFGDLSLTLNRENITTSLQRDNLDGESLTEELSICLSKLLNAFGLIVSEDNTTFIHTTRDCSEDKLRLYFLETLQIICKAILSAQELTICLPWQLDEDELSTDTRIQLAGMLHSLGCNISFLSHLSWNDAQFVSQSIHTIMDALLELRCHAAEGCSSMGDLSENVIASLLLLTETDSILTKRECCYISNFPYNPLFTQHEHSSLLALWMKLYVYVAELLPVISKQDKESLFKLLHVLQDRLSTTSLILPLGGVRSTLTNMASNLLDYKLASALHLATLILNDHLNIASRWNEKDWSAVELLCSVMSQYFTDNLISFESPCSSSGRKTKLSQNSITMAVRAQNLTGLWNANHNLMLLLCCGRLHEASILASDLQSWRVALCIAATAEKVRAFINKPLTTSVFELLQSRLRYLLPFDLLNTSESGHTASLSDYHPEHLTTALSDLFKVAVMVGHDLPSWVASSIINRLKVTCQKLPLLISEDLHLPAPPLYLPQPAVGMEDSQSLLLRHEISVVMQTLLVVYHCIGITQAMLLWYLDKLQGKSSSESTSRSMNSISSEALDGDAAVILSSFRDACALMWMLHVREKLNIALRNYQAKREKKNSVDNTIDECLAWVSRMMPFCKYLDCEVELQHLVLCLCCERSHTSDIVSILADYFWDSENVSPKIQPRLSLLLQKLRETSTVSSCDKEQKSQPLSIQYQQLCRIKMQCKAASQSALFTDEERKTIASSLSSALPFENDQLYSTFISQLCAVVSGKSETMSFTPKTRSNKKKSKNFLLLYNRHDLALCELEDAAEYFKQKKFSSKLQNDPLKLQSAQCSTPKSKMKKAGSLTHISSSQHETCTSYVTFEDGTGLPMQGSLKHYFSQPCIANIYDDDVCKTANTISSSIETCLLFKISDVPQAMQKRFRRLLPYMAWLEYWMLNDSSSVETATKPAIPLRISRQQLIQSLLIAELRFGRNTFTAFNNALSGGSKLRKIDVPSQPNIPPTTATNVQHEHDVSDITDQALSKVVADHLETFDHSNPASPLTSLSPTDRSSALTTQSPTMPVHSSNNGTDEDSLQDVARDANQEDEKQSMDEEEMPSSLDTEESLGNYADGEGSPRRSQSSPLPSAKANNNIENIVRSEIHNVLLAQQVSLLSQILLGQTLTSSGGPTPLPQGVDIFSLLRQQTNNIQSQEQNLPLQQDSTNVHGDREEHSIPLHHQKSHPVYANENTNRYDIPFFHVPGITKLEEPKHICLIHTPKTMQGWKTSVESSPKQKKISFQTAMKTVIQTSPGSIATQRVIPPVQFQPAHLLPAVPLQPPHTSLHPSHASKTTFPILTHTSFNKVFHIKKTQESVKLPSHDLSSSSRQTPTFVQMHATSAPSHMKGNHLPVRELQTRLIDPAEVLSFHQQKKNNFFQIKKTTSRLRLKSPPIFFHPLQTLHKAAPEKEVIKPSCLQDVDSKKKDLSEDVDHISEDSVKHDLVLPMEPKSVETFHGYLDQDDVNHEVEVLLQSDDEEKLSQASAHLIAALVKQTHARPRVVDAGTQAEDKKHESLISDEDFRKNLTTKPLQPPPELLDKIRREAFYAPDHNQESSFIHVGDVGIATVVHGVTSHAESAAEAHYKATHTSREDLSHATGLPEDVMSSLTQHVENASRVGEIRAVTQERWSVAMATMNAQLHSMEQMSRKMNADFKVAARMVEHVEMANDNVSMQARSCQTSEDIDLFQAVPSQSASDATCHQTSPRNIDILPRQSPSMLGRIHTNDYRQNVDEVYEQSPFMLGRIHTDDYRRKVVEAIELATSAVDDKAEVMIEKMERSPDDHVPVSFDAAPLDELSQHENLPPYQAEDSLEHDISHHVDAGKDKIKSWEKRNEDERNEVRRWMKRKRRERSVEYMEELKRKRGGEKNRFEGREKPTSDRALVVARHARDAKRKAMLGTHTRKRMEDGIELLGTLKSDQVSKVLRGGERREALRDANGRSSRNINEAQQVPRYATTSSTPRYDNADNFNDVSSSSLLSSWSLNDDVRRILYGTVTSENRKRGKSQVTFRIESPRETLDLPHSDGGSRGTASLLAEMDWVGLDAMLATVQE